jgi:RimJ/RimL family protein N-acetyltransferase
LAKLAVRTVLEMAREEARWGLVHAFPAVTNAPSNGICRSLGFRFVEEREVVFAGVVLQTNHWIIDPGSDLIGRVG